MIAFAIVVVAGLACGGWLLGRPLPLAPPTPGERRTASIVVPARDEADVLPRLLRSIDDLEPGPLEVIVVDDGSTDGTAAIAREMGALVVTAPPPPAGWVGKPWACRLGAEAAVGELLLFLDADVVLAPDALGRLLATHAEDPDGLLSVQPHHRAGPCHEQLSAYPNLVALMASGAAVPRGDGRTSVAFGPCLLTSARAYAAVGGHTSVAGEVVEDVHLARRYRSDGRSVRVRVGRDAVAFRMYPGGPAQLIEGWTKNLAEGARLAPAVPALGAFLWVVAGFAVVSAGARLATPGATVGVLPVAVAWAGISLQLRWLLRKVGSFRRWTAAAFPVPLVAFALLVLTSTGLRILRRPVRWRGRQIPTGTR